MKQSAGEKTRLAFSREDYDAYVGRLEIKEELRKAIFNDYEGFSLHYQPIVDAKNYEIRGAEALLRWDSSRYGKMPPGDFIPVMEESGLIIPMGSYVIKEAVLCCCRLKKVIPLFHMNINLSYVQLKKSDVLQELRNHWEWRRCALKISCWKLRKADILKLILPSGRPWRKSAGRS